MANQQILQSASPNIRLFPLTQFLSSQAMSDLQPRGYSIKPLALLFSRCRECILMDVDAFIIVPPDYFFDSIEEYRRTGALFFHDRMLHASSTVRRDFVLSIISRTTQDEPDNPPFLLKSSYTPFKLFMDAGKYEMQESGLIVLDKRRSPRTIAALLVAASLNMAPLRSQLPAPVFGDKETYWIGMEVVRAPYAFNGMYAGNMGTLDRSLWSGWLGVCGGTMVHLARSQPKRLLWFNGGLTHCKYRPEIEKSHEPAQWDAWTVDGPWANTETEYCMRSLFDGILQWNSLLRLRFGTHIRRVRPADKRILNQLLQIHEQVKKIHI